MLGCLTDKHGLGREDIYGGKEKLCDNIEGWHAAY